MSVGPAMPGPGGAIAPPRPPMAPPNMPAPPPPAGAMPPPMAPPAPPPPPNPGGLGPASPFMSLLTDVSASMGPGWQQVDVAASALKIALRSTDFQKTPKVVAVLQSCLTTLETLVSHYVAGKTGSVSTPSTSPSGGGSAPVMGDTSADADSQPSASSSDSDEP